MSHGEHREEFDVAEHPHGFDTGEPKGRFIALFGAGTVVLLVATVLAIQFYFDNYKEQQVYISVLAPESDQLKDLRAKEDTALHSYGYNDRQKGEVRIPIERAMDLLAKEAAEDRLPYSTKPVPVKKPEDLAAAEAAAANANALGAPTSKNEAAAQAAAAAGVQSGAKSPAQMGPQGSPAHGYTKDGTPATPNK